MVRSPSEPPSIITVALASASFPHMSRSQSIACPVSASSWAAMWWNAAAISGEDAIETGIQGSVYALRTVVLPFVFIYNPMLLMIDVRGWFEVLLVAFTATVASCVFAAATMAWFHSRCKWWEIVLLLLLALLLFGAKRLPEIGKSMGRGMREFKDSVSGKDRDDDEPAAEEPGAIEAAVPAEADAAARKFGFDSSTDLARVGELRCVEQPPEERLGLARAAQLKEGVQGECRVTHPAESVVPVALAADLLGE